MKQNTFFKKYINSLYFDWLKIVKIVKGNDTKMVACIPPILTGDYCLLHKYLAQKL